MKFRKKPVVIDAVQFTADDEACITALKEMGLTPAIVCYDKKTHAPSLSIKTLEGTMVANVGDWVIKGVNGEFYPYKDDIFKKTYEGSASAVGMPFGQAIEALKAGKKVARRGWNGNRPIKVPPYPNHEPKARVELVEPLGLVYFRVASGEIGVADECDLDLINKHNWCLMSSGYPAYTDNTKTPRITVTLHSLIIPDVEEGFVVDHINGDKLDNRRCNLRVASVHMNIVNSKARKGTSQYKGVSFDSSRDLWISSIQPSGEGTKHLGRFAKEEDAAKAYDKAAWSLYGEYARMNFPGDLKSVPRMYLYLVHGTEVDMQALRNEASRILPSDDAACHGTGSVLFNGHIDMRTADGSICVGWLASQTDMLSCDWEIVP